MKFILIAFLLFTVTGFSQIKIKKGLWIADIQINQFDKIPFHIDVNQDNEKNYTFHVINGKEKIKLEPTIVSSDSIVLRFPAFDSDFQLNVSKKKMTGVWQNHFKNDYRIPFSAKRKKQSRFSSKKKTNHNVDGKWKVTFGPNSEDAYPAIGLFEQIKNKVTGTFLTETGDYRFLEGNIVGDSLFLSCLDGSHAFLFKAGIKNGKLHGKFFSGKHWSTDWIAERNDSFELPDPEKITFVKENQKVTFSLPDLENKTFNFPSEKTNGKVTILQIMGTWCPNCYDETIFLKEIYDTYHSDGLEIISIGYEIPKDFKGQAEVIKRFKEKLNLKHTFLVGGYANKKGALKNFTMLNDIVSFPTTIIIGRDGKVELVHTGFNGPGTGEVYEKFTKKVHTLLKNLLAK